MENPDPIADACAAGFDLSLIDCNLSYTPQKRAELHQAALEMALEMERAGQELRDKSQRSA